MPVAPGSKQRGDRQIVTFLSPFFFFFFFFFFFLLNPIVAHHLPDGITRSGLRFAGTGDSCLTPAAVQCRPYYCDTRNDQCFEACAFSTDCNPLYACDDGVCVQVGDLLRVQRCAVPWGGTGGGEVLM